MSNDPIKRSDGFSVQPYDRVPDSIRAYVEDIILEGPDKINNLIKSGDIFVGPRQDHGPVLDKHFVIHTSPTKHMFSVYWNDGKSTYTASAYTVDII